MTISRPRAAAAGGASADPYQVLGLKQGASYEQIQRAYNNLRREYQGNEEKLSQLESAHTSIMMSQLSMRLQGGAEVAKEVKYADRAVFFPWRPRVCVDEKKAILRNLIVAAVLAAWSLGFADTCFTQPMIVATGVAIAGNFVKQCVFFPTGGRYATDEEKKNVTRNLVRAAGLSLGSMFLGIFTFYTAPEYVGTLLGKTMPYWFYESQNVLLNMGSIIMNFVTVSFLR